MEKMLRVFQYELRWNVRRKGFLFMTFGLPALLFVLVFGYNFITTLNASDADEPQEEAESELFDFGGIETAGYVDQSGLFDQVPQRLEGRLIPYADVEAAREALNAGEVDVFYVIAEDYVDTGDVTLHVPGLSVSMISSQPIDQLVYETRVRDMDTSLLFRLQDPAVFQEFDLSRSQAEDVARNEDADFLLLYVFAIVFGLSLFLTNGYLMQTVIEEKETRLIEILISTLRPLHLLGGKILALGIMGLMQVVVWVVSLVLLLRLAVELPAFQSVQVLASISLPLDLLPLMLVYFVLGYLLFAALYGAVGAISSSMREGPQYAVIFTLPAVLPLYFLGVFIETPNATIPVVLSMIPITSPVAMVMRLTVSAVPPAELILSIALLVLGVLAAMWLAGRMFRVNTLLAGQPPRLRDIPTLLRG